MKWFYLNVYLIFIYVFVYFYLFTYLFIYYVFTNKFILPMSYIYEVWFKWRPDLEKKWNKT